MKFLAVAFITILSLSSCNTIKGLGRDTQMLGQSLQRTAERAAPSTQHEQQDDGAPIY